MKKRLLGLILVVLMMFPLAIKATGEETSASTSDKAIEVVKPPEAPAPSPGLLMFALGKAGLAEPLDKAGINIYGYLDGGYMHDFSEASAHHGPTFLGFNNFKNAGILDKISLNVERTVDPTKKKLDFGFHVEGIWGADAAFVRWMPSGLELVVAATWRGSRLSIRRVALEGGASVPFQPALEIGQPTALPPFDISRESRFIAYSSARTLGDIWVSALRPR